MFTIDIDSFYLAILLTGLVVFTGLSFYYDRRHCRTLKLRAVQRCVFHCAKCNQVYGQIDQGHGASCPHCGFVNAPLQF